MINWILLFLFPDHWWFYLLSSVIETVIFPVPSTHPMIVPLFLVIFIPLLCRLIIPLLSHHCLLNQPCHPQFLLVIINPISVGSPMMVCIAYHYPNMVGYCQKFFVGHPIIYSWLVLPKISHHCYHPQFSVVHPMICGHSHVSPPMHVKTPKKRGRHVSLLERLKPVVGDGKHMVL